MQRVGRGLAEGRGQEEPVSQGGRKGGRLAGGRGFRADMHLSLFQVG